MTPESTRASLENARSDAISLALELEDLAAALRVIAQGQAGPEDVQFVRSHIDDFGDLVVAQQTLPGADHLVAWALLFAHAADPEEAR